MTDQQKPLSAEERRGLMSALDAAGLSDMYGRFVDMEQRLAAAEAELARKDECIVDGLMQRKNLQAKIAELERRVASLSGHLDNSGEQIAELERQLEEARKDAERYRWLRTQNWDEADLCVVAYPRNAVKLGHDCPSLDRLDDAIDAAMTEEAGHD